MPIAYYNKIAAACNWVHNCIWPGAFEPLSFVLDPDPHSPYFYSRTVNFLFKFVLREKPSQIAYLEKLFFVM